MHINQTIWTGAISISTKFRTPSGTLHKPDVIGIPVSVLKHFVICIVVADMRIIIAVDRNGCVKPGVTAATIRDIRYLPACARLIRIFKVTFGDVIVTDVGVVVFVDGDGGI